MRAATPQQQQASKPIVKRVDLTPSRSPSDPKEYRLIVLQNGLECLLVSTFSEQQQQRQQQLHHHAHELSKRLSTASQASFAMFDQPSQARTVRNFSEDLLSFRISDVGEEEEEEAEGEGEGEEAWKESVVLEDIAPTTPKRISLRPYSSNVFRDSSSKQSAGAWTSPTPGRKSYQPQQQRPSVVGGIMSGEAGRKLSKIISPDELFPTPPPPPPTLAHSLSNGALTKHTTSRMSISVETTRPPALRLSRLRVVSDTEEPSTPPATSTSRPPSPRKHRLSHASARGSILFHNTVKHSGNASPSSAASTLVPSSLPFPSVGGGEGFDTCAVAMGVGAGSFATPPRLDGLAHFLEHMLFMGSKQFPKENDFDLALSRAGGSCNAFTDTEQTMYHFVAPLPHLKDCLQVFSQFFVNPLLLPECSDREIRIIENEFASRKTLDRCRLQEIWRETSRIGTPYGKFTCGNLKTLTPLHVDVNVALREFYNEHYVTNNMKLVMVSGDSLSQMESIATDLFKDCRVVDSASSLNGKSGKQAGLYGYPWDSENALGKVFRIVPMGGDVNEVQMTWQLDPKLAKAYKSKPCEYIAHLLSHECTGSVINELKSRGWAHTLVAGVSLEDGFTHNSGVSLFNITISLTPLGMGQWIFVVALLFEFLGIVQRCGLEKWIFDELQQVASIHYRFQEEVDPKTLAQQLCSELLASETDEDRLHLLNKAHLLFEWDPVSITQVLEVLLDVDKVRIDLMSTRLGSNLPPPPTTPSSASQDEELVRLLHCDRATRLPLVEEFTGAIYWQDSIPEPVSESWRAVSKGNSTVGYISTQYVFPERLGLPHRNPYISSNFDLKSTRRYDFTEHVLIGAELKLTLNGSGGKLSGTSSLRRFSNLTTKAGWEFGVVLAVDYDSILVRYPMREGVRKWHRLNHLVHLQVDDLLRKLLPVDFGNASLLFTMIPRAIKSPSRPIQSSTCTTTQQDDFDYAFQPTDSYLWKKHFPKSPSDVPEFPTLACGSDHFFSLWMLPDTSFRSPRVQVFLSFLTPNVCDTATSAALADLFAIMVYESLVQESYLGYLVDLNFDLEIINGMGIQLHFSGFSHKLMDLVKIVLRRTLFFTQCKRSAAGSFQSPTTTTPTTLAEDEEYDQFLHYFVSPDQDAPQDVDLGQFTMKFDALLNDYFTTSTRFRSGGKQVSSVMFDLLCNSLWTPMEKAHALRTTTPTMLIDFASNLFSTCKVEGLIEGNLDEQDCNRYFKCIRAALDSRGCKPIRSDIEPILRSQTIPVVQEKDQPVSGLIHVLEAVESTSHSVELFFQIGAENSEDRVLATVLEHLLAEPMYAELRTKQQLGYSLKCGVRFVCGTLGFVFEITSNAHGPELLALDVDNFLKLFRTKLVAMSSEEYVLNASSLAMRLLTRPNNLHDQANRHWDCILSHALHALPYVWNSNLVDYGLIRSTASKSRVLEAFDSWLDPEQGKRRRASVYVVGANYKRDQLLRELNKSCVTYIGTVTHPTTTTGHSQAKNKPSSTPCVLM
ncbi:hypothetical protein BASA81_003943 [Batrachochytrium salamandrivorans]|nr:hypothetical protein BASA81_003943 [Batrachochytrium salamandrivorans]